MSTTPASPPLPPAAPPLAPEASPRPYRRILSVPVISWVLYDFANTIFSYVVLTRYFNDWVVIERGRPDYYLGVMSICVSALLLLTLPLFGALSDRLGRHKPFLAAFTLASVAGTALLGLVGGVIVGLVVAGVAIFAFNSAEAQYHPLLATVAAPERRSRVSGLGVGVGYVGVLLALFVLGALVPDGDNQAAFLPAAVMFLVFGLPCLLFVRDRAPVRGADLPPVRGLPRQAFGQLVASVREARSQPWGRFLLARFLYVDAIATVIAFMTVYARRTGDFTGREIDLLLALATVFAIAGAVVAGMVTERIGPKRVIVGTLVGVTAALLATGLSGSSALLWFVGPVVGAALGSVSATDRVFLMRLVPPERRGEDFGLYALVGKVSNGFGPLVLWSGTIALFSEGLALTDRFGASRVAICVLALTALAGALVLRPLAEPPPERPDAPAG